MTAAQLRDLYLDVPPGILRLVAKPPGGVALAGALLAVEVMSLDRAGVRLAGVEYRVCGSDR